MRNQSLNQSIIVFGESGSGKTETSKHLINYLCGSMTTIQKQIMNEQPISNAFGNAKTMRNKNSSRCGKFIEVFLIQILEKMRHFL